MTASIPSVSPRARLRRAPARSHELVIRDGIREVVRDVPPAPPAIRHRVPTLLLAGVSHADAGALSVELGRHPQVCLPATRRIDHFTPLRYGLAAEAPLEDYDRHFSGWRGERYRLETSPVYFDGGTRLVAEVAAAMPDAQVVLLLRDPALRLWTSFTDKVRRGRLPEAMPFDRFVDRCLALRTNGCDRFEGNRYYRTLSSGFYMEHLPRWFDAFGGRVHVVFAEHVAANPERELARLLSRLDLDPAELVVAPEPAAPPEPTPTPARSGLSWFWPLVQRAAGPARVERGDRIDERLGVPRQGERQRNRVRALYSQANRELATYLRPRGVTRFPDWLLDA
jgi:hypothetical protein